MERKTLKRAYWLLFLFFVSSAILSASTLDRGVDLYKQRKLDEAVNALNEIKDTLPPQESKSAYLLLARCYWIKGTYYTEDREKKAEVFARGLRAMERAQTIIGEDAGFYYWMAVFIGEKANLFFSMESLTAVDTIKDLCSKVIAINQSTEDGGAYIILGRMYYKIPGLFGGSNEESIKYLLMAKEYEDRKPVSGRKHFVYKFLAESYYAQREWENAHQTLLEGLRCPPDPDAPWENEGDYREMKELLKDITKRLEKE
jgi:tetratricopeptide (TPR) repeat protein